jgi:hypothetical protein
MTLKHLIWSVTTVSLLSTGSIGIAQTDRMQHQTESQASGPVVAAVRRATEQFKDVQAAIAAGYVQNLGCVSGPNEGAMGVHYVLPAAFDDQIDVDQPEALVYEPRNGRLHLVAAEYITDAAVWQAGHGVGVQPFLMGHLFHYAPGPNRYGPGAFYELHVWAWKANPRGTHADWNPNVSCSSWETMQ